jgi:hypothetical protein
MANTGKFEVTELSFKVGDDKKSFVVGCGNTGQVDCGQNTAKTFEAALSDASRKKLIADLRNAVAKLEA